MRGRTVGAESLWPPTSSKSRQIVHLRHQRTAIDTRERCISSAAIALSSSRTPTTAVSTRSPLGMQAVCFSASLLCVSPAFVCWVSHTHPAQARLDLPFLLCQPTCLWRVVVAFLNIITLHTRYIYLAAIARNRPSSSESHGPCAGPRASRGV